MLFPRISLLSVIAGLAAISNAFSAESSSQSRANTTRPTVPGHCSTTIDDFEHTTGYVKTHECYTRTSTAPAATCPTFSCAPKATDVICPEYIKVSSVTVPCATDCCPTTSTVYEPAGPCSTCDSCKIPTEWWTYTTGCVGTPTITSHTIVTPP
ncbi:Uu.00g018330.m01.CDS01 [Anthostomella pinea]|uniref:Uu.00g018330.m01.CDS01 n=1 Tax=Anthostomella pinea TaxID=933095 RepID=A0AAI8YQJ5_9PEZI|nr:Uu.00g018330.m01.CDS01 [Anthostomella pinea]